MFDAVLPLIIEKLLLIRLFDHVPSAIGDFGLDELDESFIQEERSTKIAWLQVSHLETMKMSA